MITQSYLSDPSHTLEDKKVIDTNDNQYSLSKIIFLWALVTIPMALLAWVVTPLLIPRVNVHPGIIFWIMMILGMVWQFIISLIILSQELKTLSWSSLKQRLWLNKPLNPRTKKPNARLFWWLVPCLVFSFLTSFALSDSLDYSVVSLFSSSSAPHYTQIENLKSPEFIGVWWVLGIALFSSLFNYFLGEELFFRGVLLPKMEKRFGRFAWLVNAILFGLYHVHKPWNLPSIILSNFAISWPAQRYRSNWMAVMVHGVEGIVLLVMVSLVVLGIGV